MTEYMTETPRDIVVADTRKSKAVTFYTRRHEETGRHCTLAVEPETGRVLGHMLACHSLACYGRLLSAARGN